MFKLPLAVRSGLMVVAVVSASCAAARAGLSIIGDVTAADDTGVPIVPYQIITASEVDTEEPIDEQTKWEKNQGIIVGVKLAQGGRMDIDGSTQVRYQDLIIGSRGTQGGIMRTGTGTVLITGNGALYSNDPLSIPPELDGIGFASDASVARDPTEGFDVYVGQWGQGRFELRNGGRAEIQDAVIVGDQPGSNGVITVDGFGSLLGNGGFTSNQLTNEAHQMIVGRQGIGQMFITGGGLVVSEGPAVGAVATDIIGAVIGGDAFEENEIPELGGTGFVTVSGLASRWVVGGSLQVGGFHDVVVGGVADAAGVNVNYNGPDGQPGRGTLRVDVDAQVQVRVPLGTINPDDQELSLAIGRFGTVDLRGGLIKVGSGIGGTQGESTPDEVQVINDGLIKGYGRIETGVFRNRYFGQVRVGIGQSLVIDSSSEFLGTPQENYPLINFGLIEVIGTADQPAELEFVRPPAALGNPLTPLINRPVATTVPGSAPTTFDGGLISAANSRLRFTSGDTATNTPGMINEGVMAFTAGYNVISGNVVNQLGTGPNPLNPQFIIGPNTTVVVEDDFDVNTASLVGPGPRTISGPFVDLTQGAKLIVLDQSTLTLAGAINMELSLSNPSQIIASGDLGLGGFLNVSLASDVLATLGDGSAFEIISFAGEAYGIDTSSGTANPSTTPIPQNLGVPLDVAISPDLNLLFPTLDPIIQRINQGIYLSFRDPSMVGGGAMGADFNGDGVVDQLDLAIWKAYKGIQTGASVLQGDANGDGAVNGLDYAIWLEKFTNGGVPGGGGSNFGGPSGSVPEPTGLALLSLGGLVALGYRRRRN